MFSQDKTLRETSPLSIFFVKSGSGGNRLLFRYPYDESFYRDVGTEILSLRTITERDMLQLQNVIGENDEALCNIFSVNPNLCGHKLEIKINNVRYVCHPMSLMSPQQQTSISPDNSFRNKFTSNEINNKTTHHRNNLVSGEGSSYHTQSNIIGSQHGDITSFNIVFALRSSASYDIVDCFHDLSKRLAIALSSEERRCSYLSREIKTIMSALDEREMANLKEQIDDSNIKNNKTVQVNSKSKLPLNNNINNIHQFGSQQQNESVFATILDRSALAKDLKRIFFGLTYHGIIELKINTWVHLSFCLPQKVHRLKLMNHKSMRAIATSDIKGCLMYLRPYHGLLLLCEPQELLESLPIDASPALIQLIKVAKPDKNFMDLSVDANLTLMQIFCIVSQLIYWAKATIIYPICDSNMYSIHPLASIGLQSELVHDFRLKFPISKSLHHYLSEFSEGTSLSQLNGPLLNVDEKQNLLSIVAWLLQRRVLTQIHKYIFLVIDGTPLTNQSLTGVNNKTTETNNNNTNDNDHKINANINSSNNSAKDDKGQMHIVNNQAAFVALQKAGLSQQAAKTVLSIPSSRNAEDLKLFISLLPYFDGKHHIEDIMFFENLDRSQVLILCDKYRDILLTCHYEDVAVSQLSPFNNDNKGK